MFLRTLALAAALTFATTTLSGVGLRPVTAASSIGVGSIQVTAIDATTGQPVAGARVVISPTDTPVLDFNLAAQTNSASSVPVDQPATDSTDATGTTGVHQFSAPLTINSDVPYQKFWSAVTVTVEATGYQTYTDYGVEILDQDTTTEQALLIPGAGQFVVTTPPHVDFAPDAPTSPALQAIDFSLDGQEQAVNDLNTTSVRDTITPNYPCCPSSYTQPANITVHMGSPNCYSCANVTMAFGDYLKHAVPAEWIDSWGSTTNGMQAMNFGADAVRTYANWDIYSCRWRCNGRNFDITTDPCCDQAYSQSTYTHSSTAVANTPHQNFEDGSYNPYGPINDQYRAYTGCYSIADKNYPYLPSIKDQVQCDHGVGNYIGTGASQWGTYWWATGHAQTTGWMVTHYYTSNTNIVSI
jgi:hypothetical protein